MKIDTTDNSKDTKNRVAAIVIYDGKFLAGHAPNKKMEPCSWDLVGKGHLELGEEPLEGLYRELLEESNIDARSEEVHFLGKFPYKEGDTISCFAVLLKKLPEKIECNCVFDWFGKKLPEFSKFEWVEIDEWKNYLYKSLVKYIPDAFEVIKKALI